MKDFCFNLPKVELHAHLNGSLSRQTTQKLIENHRNKYPNEEIVEADRLFNDCSNIHCLENPFEIFPLIQQLTDHAEAIQIATREVIQEFAEDNVKYLELRSTPREVPGRMTKEEYVNAIIDEIRKNKGDIIVKYILSVDRRQGVEVAKDSMRLWERFHKQYPLIVCGVDLSGDPKKGDVVSLLEVFRRYDAKYTLHAAESLHTKKETKLLLQFRPHRIGHGIYIHPENGGTGELYSILMHNKTPVEVCLTSNHMSQTVKEYKDSHFFPLYSSNHPIVICTDDKGIFDCSLSGEYSIVADILKLTSEQLFQLSFNAIQHIFGSDEEKTFLQHMWNNWWKEFRNK